MDFLSSHPSPIFFQTKAEELDELIFKERMRRLEKRMNEIATDMTNEESYKLVAWLKKRTLFCERCNLQFYSNEGFVMHGCFK